LCAQLRAEEENKFVESVLRYGLMLCYGLMSADVFARYVCVCVASAAHCFVCCMSRMHLH
jgi:hypothetical protein